VELRAPSSPTPLTNLSKPPAENKGAYAMGFFKSPHPIAEIVFGCVLLALGLLVAPFIRPPGQRTVLDPITAVIPTPWLVIILVVCALGVIAQGVGALIIGRRNK